MSDETLETFCARHQVSTASLCKWRREVAAGGYEALEPKRNPRNTPRPAPLKRYTPEQCREAVEAFQRSGRTRKEFCRIWGVNPRTLANWLEQYTAQGLRGLEPGAGSPKVRAKGTAGEGSAPSPSEGQPAERSASAAERMPDDRKRPTNAIVDTAGVG